MGSGSGRCATGNLYSINASRKFFTHSLPLYHLRAKDEYVIMAWWQMNKNKNNITRGEEGVTSAASTAAAPMRYRHLNIKTVYTRIDCFV